jgi:hypothetical protein
MKQGFASPGRAILSSLSGTSWVPCRSRRMAAPILQFRPIVRSFSRRSTRRAWRCNPCVLPPISAKASTCRVWAATNQATGRLYSPSTPACPATSAFRTQTRCRGFPAFQLRAPGATGPGPKLRELPLRRIQGQRQTWDANRSRGTGTPPTTAWHHTMASMTTVIRTARPQANSALGHRNSTNSCRTTITDSNSPTTTGINWRYGWTSVPCFMESMRRTRARPSCEAKSHGPLWSSSAPSPQQQQINGCVPLRRGRTSGNGRSRHGPRSADRDKIAPGRRIEPQTAGPG